MFLKFEGKTPGHFSAITGLPWVKWSTSWRCLEIPRAHSKVNSPHCFPATYFHPRLPKLRGDMSRACTTEMLPMRGLSFAFWKRDTISKRRDLLMFWKRQIFQPITSMEYEQNNIMVCERRQSLISKVKRTWRMHPIAHLPSIVHAAFVHVPPPFFTIVPFF